MNQMDPIEFEKIDRALTKDDMDDIDMSDIGLSDEDVSLGNYEMKEVMTKSSVSKTTDMMKTATTQEAKDAISDMQSKDLPGKIEKFLSVYEVSKKGSEEVTYISKVVVSINIDQNMKNFEVIEQIPKSVAKSVSELVFSEKVIVLEDDPIVKWDLKYAPEGQTKEYSYTVNKKIESIDSNTVAGGDKMGWSFFAWLAGLFA